MYPALTRSGKRGWCSITGPSAVTGAPATSATTCTACGLPIETTLTSTVRPSTSSGWVVASRSATNGISAGAKRGTPMSTVTLPSSPRIGTITPPAVSTRISRFAVSP